MEWHLEQMVVWVKLQVVVVVELLEMEEVVSVEKREL